MCFISISSLLPMTSYGADRIANTTRAIWDSERGYLVMRRSRVRFPPLAHSICDVSSIDMLPAQVDSALRSISMSHPYPRFIVDDVLDPVEYEKLLQEFPDHLVGDPGDDGFVNYTIRPNVTASERLSQSWQEFVSTIRSDDVKARLVRACLPSTSRRYPAWWRWMLYFRLKKVDNYEINLAFSANYAGRYLPPHTDNSYKVLALVLYFAPRDYTGIEEGTRFFRAKSSAVLKAAVRRYNRLSDSRITRLTPLALQPMTSVGIHSGALTTLEERESEAWFRQNFDNDFNVEFHPNRIAGFIKTQNSFHAVDMRNSNYVGPRRSLLINLNLKHSFAARAWQFFRTRVLRLSS